MSMKYVPLHIHTEYSLLDGAIRVKDLFKFAKENDMPAVAITDHGTMFGVIMGNILARERITVVILKTVFYSILSRLTKIQMLVFFFMPMENHMVTLEMGKMLTFIMFN